MSFSNGRLYLEIYSHENQLVDEPITLKWIQGAKIVAKVNLNSLKSGLNRDEEVMLGTAKIDQKHSFVRQKARPY